MARSIISKLKSIFQTPANTEVDEVLHDVIFSNVYLCDIDGKFSIEKTVNLSIDKTKITLRKHDDTTQSVPITNTTLSLYPKGFYLFYFLCYFHQLNVVSV